MEEEEKVNNDEVTKKNYEEEDTKPSATSSEVPPDPSPTSPSIKSITSEHSPDPSNDSAYTPPEPSPTSTSIQSIPSQHSPDNVTDPAYIPPVEEEDELSYGPTDNESENVLVNTVEIVPTSVITDQVQLSLHVGLKNLGNTCWLNSSVQFICRIQTFLDGFHKFVTNETFIIDLLKQFHQDNKKVSPLRLDVIKNIMKEGHLLQPLLTLTGRMDLTPTADTVTTNTTDTGYKFVPPLHLKQKISRVFAGEKKLVEFLDKRTQKNF